MKRRPPHSRHFPLRHPRKLDRAARLTILHAESGAIRQISAERDVMTLKNRILSALVVLAVAGAAPLGAASASTSSQFSAAVARVLNSIRGGQQALADMSNSEFRAFVRCAQKVMSDAPPARKQYVLKARNLNEQRKRFDEVALDNRAELKQRITRECYY